MILFGALSPADASDIPSPARRCADAAIGAEVEVCLRLAVENPDAVVEIAAALIAHVDRTQAPDREILDALLLLTTSDGQSTDLSKRRALDGVRALSSLQDPRVAPILLAVAGSAPEEIAIAAIAALSAHQEQIPALSAWLVDRQRPLAVRIAIARALGRAHTPEAADGLVAALRRPRTPPSLRAEIERTLLFDYPERAIPSDIPPDADGAPWLAAGASIGLGYAMGAVGHFGRLELWPVGALTGSVGGASVGYLYGRAWPIEAADAAFIATSGVGLGAAGALIGLASRKPGDDRVDRPLLFGLAGETVGFAISPLFAGIHRGTAPDQVEALVFAGALGAAGEATSRFLVRNDIASPPDAALAAAGFTGGLLAGEIVAPRWTPEASLGLLATGALAGTSVGLLLPIGSRTSPLAPSSRHRTELVAATALGGTALGAVLAGPLDPAEDVLIGGAAGASFGVGLGAGVGLVFAPDTPDIARGLALAGLVGGYGSGAFVSFADPDPIDDRDVAFTMACAGWGALNSYAIADLLGAERDRRLGSMLVGASMVASASIVGNLELDVPVPHTLSASSIGLWGVTAGLAVSEIADLEPFALALPLGNAGWIVGGVLVSPLVGTHPFLIGIADAGGVLGTAIAGVGSGLLTDDPDLVLLSSMIGGGVGLTGGAVLGARWLDSTSRWDGAMLPRLPVQLPALASVSLSPMPLRGGYGAAISVNGW